MYRERVTGEQHIVVRIVVRPAHSPPRFLIFGDQHPGRQTRAHDQGRARPERGGGEPARAASRLCADRSYAPQQHRGDRGQENDDQSAEQEWSAQAGRAADESAGQ
jgi:hypothetical protein